jgi:hypothetical protein
MTLRADGLRAVVLRAVFFAIGDLPSPPTSPLYHNLAASRWARTSCRDDQMPPRSGADSHVATTE